MANNQLDQRPLVTQVRILIVISALLFVLVIASLAMVINTSKAVSRGVEPLSDTITVSRLLVKDSNAQLRAQLAASDKGATLTFLNSAGGQALALTSEGGEPKVSLMDEQGRIRLQFYVTNAGTVSQYLGVNGPRLSLGESAAGGNLIMFDQTAIPRVELGPMDYGPGRTAPKSLFNLFDETGKHIYSVDTSP